MSTIEKSQESQEPTIRSGTIESTDETPNAAVTQVTQELDKIKDSCEKIKHLLHKETIENTINPKSIDVIDAYIDTLGIIANSLISIIKDVSLRKKNIEQLKNTSLPGSMMPILEELIKQTTTSSNTDDNCYVIHNTLVTNAYIQPTTI